MVRCNATVDSTGEWIGFVWRCNHTIHWKMLLWACITILTWIITLDDANILVLIWYSRWHCDHHQTIFDMVFCLECINARRKPVGVSGRLQLNTVHQHSTWMSSTFKERLGGQEIVGRSSASIIGQSKVINTSLCEALTVALAWYGCNTSVVQ